MRRVLVTGAAGQLGLDVVDAFEGAGAAGADVEVVALDRRHLDITDRAAVAGCVATVRPDVVVNCAALTDVDGCESDPDRAHAVNALGPWWLARACASVDATLVTVSTDYVFDGIPLPGPGGEPRGYTEFDPVAPRNVYGRSKAAGEQLVRETLEAHHIVRTAWLAGARGHSFVRTMLRLGLDGATLRVVDDQHGSPSFTRDVAAAIRTVVDAGLPGTVNLVNDGVASWFDLAAAVFAASGRTVQLVPQPSTALDRAADRPAWSVLDTTHARGCGVPSLGHWRDGLARLLGEIGVADTAGGRS